MEIDLLIIACVALATSFLTFFSGFGLGTLLLPAMAMFFTIDLAVALTAIVHFLNNIFKFSLLRAHINKVVFIGFAPFAIPGAFLGAVLFTTLSIDSSILLFDFYSIPIDINLPGLVIGLLIIVFALLELNEQFLQIIFKDSFLWIGGLLSGFFGGLSGHQGALRSMFLLKANLNKEQYIATGVAISLIIDIIRLIVYGKSKLNLSFLENIDILLAGIIPALLGAVLGKFFLKKITIKLLHKYVAWALLILGSLIVFGFV